MSVYVEKADYAKKYADAQRNSRQYFENFDEYERIANNKLNPKTSKELPKVNDGSLAALLIETPMRVLAQMPTGVVKVTDSDEGWFKALADVVWTNTIVPNANTQADLFTKIRIALYRALQYGAQPIYSFFTVRGDYKGADCSLPYVRDVYLEPGKVSDEDSDYIFMDTYYTTMQIDGIIEQAEQAIADGVETSWDPKKLREVKEAHKSDKKDNRAQNAEERSNTQVGESIKLTTIFNRGVDAPFCTFSVGGSDSDAVIVRERTNDDPTGDLPIHFLYAFEDLINPQGKGQVEISGPTQNVLDYMTQSDVLATQIGLRPPVKIAGNRSNTKLDSLVYGPAQRWLVGEAQVDPVHTATEIYTQFPQRYGLYKTQLMNMQGTTDASVGSDSGNPSFSKTHAGVELQQARTNAHDNFLRNQVNKAFRQVAKSMLNIHFANMEGSDVMTLTDTEAERLMVAGLIDEDPDTKKPSAQEIEMEWENLRGEFDFDVDPDSSIVKDDQEQVDKLTQAAELVSKDPNVVQAIASSGYQVNMGEIYKQIFTKLGLQDVEKILSPMQQQAGGVTPGMEGAEMAGQPEPDVDPNQVQQIMNEMGLNEEQATFAARAFAQGYPTEEIAKYLVNQAQQQPEVVNG